MFHTCCSLCMEWSFHISTAWLILHISTYSTPIRKSMSPPPPPPQEARPSCCMISHTVQCTAPFLDSSSCNLNCYLNIHLLLQPPWEKGSHLFHSLLFSPLSCTMSNRYSILFTEHESIMLKELKYIYIYLYKLMYHICYRCFQKGTKKNLTVSIGKRHAQMAKWQNRTWSVIDRDLDYSETTGERRLTPNGTYKELCGKGSERACENRQDLHTIFWPTGNSKIHDRSSCPQTLFYSLLFPTTWYPKCLLNSKKQRKWWFHRTLAVIHSKKCPFNAIL